MICEQYQCESGNKGEASRRWDARGIYAGRMCVDCFARWRASRPDVFRDPNYEASESIDPAE